MNRETCFFDMKALECYFFLHAFQRFDDAVDLNVCFISCWTSSRNSASTTIKAQRTVRPIITYWIPYVFVNEAILNHTSQLVQVIFPDAMDNVRVMMRQRRSCIIPIVNRLL